MATLRIGYLYQMAAKIKQIKRGDRMICQHVFQARLSYQRAQNLDEPEMQASPKSGLPKFWAKRFFRK